MPEPMHRRSRPDPQPGETHVRAAGVRSIDVDARTVDVIASTETLDSHDTVLVQDWDLERFRRNPVVLWAHNATLGMDELPIGRCTRAEVVNGALECTIHFAGADVNPRAEQVFQAYRQGFLKAVSVGFNPRSYRWEMRDGTDVLVFFDNELIELSCVPVGSNPDALARALNARNQPPVPAADPPARPPTHNEDDMTDEERKLLEWARRAMELLGVTDPAGGEARIRGLLDAQKQAEAAEAELTETRKALAQKRHAEVVEAALRDGRLPPRAEWTEEQREYIEGLSAEAPRPGPDGRAARSPLEVYVATLTRRAPVNERSVPKTDPAAGATRAPAQPHYARQTKPEYVERAAQEQRERRASGFAGPRLTDAPKEGD
jgi:HK97 family phage prohead protease